MYLIIDHYDSFTYNLAAYFQELGVEICVKLYDKVTIRDIKTLQPAAIILSPGPKTPTDAKNSLAILTAFAGRIPILGICLGHQIIACAYGAEIKRGLRPMHGKVTAIKHGGEGLFQGLPSHYEVTRYHSLVVTENSLPTKLKIDAYSEDDSVMAISHCRYPLYGIQFHPEALLTRYGHELLQNFVKLTKQWWRKKYGEHN